MNKRDLYSGCNVDGFPVNDFITGCCSHCHNSECTRSSSGKSKFDARVSTWYERLFSNSPKMDPEDPRYPKIAGQKFILINPPLTVHSGWVDPRDLEVPKTSLQKSTPLTPQEDPILIGSNASLETQPITVQEKTLEQKKKPENLGHSINTPIQREQVLPSVDTWNAPISTTDTKGVRVVKPGEKIKF